MFYLVLSEEWGSLVRSGPKDGEYLYKREVDLRAIGLRKWWLTHRVSREDHFEYSLGQRDQSEVGCT